MASITVPSFQDILNQVLQDYQSITTSQGYNVSVDPSTTAYAGFYSDAQICSMIYYVSQQASQGNLPGTATGTDLDNLANLRNIFRKGAVPAQGFVQFMTSTPQTIAAGALLTGPNSLQYQVTQTNIYSNLQLIPISCLVAGSASNLEVGSSMTWASAPFNSQPSVPAYTPITGGTDSESDDALRARLLSVIQYPMQAGNASYLVTLASTLDPLIQQAFVYSNYNGAGTLLFCLCGNQTSSYIGRDIPHLLLDNYQPDGYLQAGLVADPTTGTPYNRYSYTDSSYTVLKNPGNNLSNDTSLLYGQLPLNLGNQYASCVTTVNHIPVSLSIAIDLPYPIGSGNNTLASGGNGWLNYQTFPNPDPDGYVQYFCQVTAIDGYSTITVQAASNVTTSGTNHGGTIPVANVTQISWINRSDSQNTGWNVITATITAFTDNGNDTWTLTLNTPLVFPSGVSDFYGVTGGVTVGDVIFPASVNGQEYLDTVINSFGLLGPGQMTTSTGLLSLGAVRFPSSAGTFTNVIDARFINAISTNNTEVIEAQFVDNNGIFATTTSGSPVQLVTTYASPLYGTPPPANAPPNLYIPACIGFYDLNAI
jgi:hypothetical protein